MYYITVFIGPFLVIYILYLLTIILRKKSLEKFKTSNQMVYFKSKYKLDMKKLDVKKFANSLALTNSFIIALTILIIDFADRLIIKLLLGFVLLIILMLICYKILGTYYKKKEGKQNV